MRMLRIATMLALGLATVLGTQALAAEESGAAKEMTKSIGQQAAVASELALYDRQADAMADLAIERSQNPEVIQFARQAKTAHETNLTAIRAWADQKKAEVAAVELMVPRQGTGGSGLTADEKKAFDDQLSKYGEEFRKDAKEAQDEVFELANASTEEFDKMFLSRIGSLHQDQIDTAKDAQRKFTADTAFTGLMSGTQTAFAQLRDSARKLEDQLRK